MSFHQMIHAVRDVASALSNLIQATTHASGRSPNDPAIGNLKEAAKVIKKIYTNIVIIIFR